MINCPIGKYDSISQQLWISWIPKIAALPDLVGVSAIPHHYCFRSTEVDSWVECSETEMALDISNRLVGERNAAKVESTNCRSRESPMFLRVACKLSGPAAGRRRGKGQNPCKAR